jgi:hypothetical protein
MQSGQDIFISGARLRGGSRGVAIQWQLLNKSNESTCVSLWIGNEA